MFTLPAHPMRYLASIALVCISSPAISDRIDTSPIFAEPQRWTLIDQGSTSDIYIDVGGIKTTKNGKQAWVLIDAKTPVKMPTGNGKFLSSLILHQFDCEEGRSRLLQVDYYSDHMAQTHLYKLRFEPPGAWGYETPESNGEKILNLVCLRK